MKKSTGFKTNHVGMVLKLQQQCTGDDEHSWLIGNQNGKSKSSAAQVSSPKLQNTTLAEYARTMQAKPRTWSLRVPRMWLSLNLYLVGKYDLFEFYEGRLEKGLLKLN